MNYKEYAQEIADRINGEVRVVQKSNGVEMYGVSRPEKDSNVTAAIYINQMCDDNLPLDDAEQYVRQELVKQAKVSIEIDWVRDYEQVKPKLKARLYNEKTPADVFRKAEGFDDLIIIPYITGLNISEEAKGCIKVRQGLLNDWGVSADEVIDTALKNVESDINLMDISAVLGLPTIPGVPVMTVITNEAKGYGAIAAMFAHDKIKELYPDGYAIIPSSIHEVIAVSKDCIEGLKEMIDSVNANCVSPEEVLSDHPYVFA